MPRTQETILKADRRPKFIHAKNKAARPRVGKWQAGCSVQGRSLLESLWRPEKTVTRARFEDFGAR